MLDIGVGGGGGFFSFSFSFSSFRCLSSSCSSFFLVSSPLLDGTFSPKIAKMYRLRMMNSQPVHFRPKLQGHSAVYAMVLPFTLWKHMHFAIELVGRSTKLRPYAHCVGTAKRGHMLH